MNAPILTRRSFAKGTGRPRARLLARSGRAAGAGRRAARLPGSLNNNRMLQRLGADRRRRQRHRLHRQGRTRAGHPDRALADRGRRARPAARAAEAIYSADTGQIARTRDRPRAASRSRTAARRCAWPAPRCAAMLVDLAAKKLGVAGEYADGRRRRHHDRRRPQGDLRRDSPPRLDLNREATGKVAPKPVSAHKIVGQSVAAPRHSRQGHRRHHLRAGHLRGRHGARPRGAAAALRLDAGKRRRSGRRSKMPGVIKVVRDGSFLGVVAEREEQAIKAREALAKAAKWKLGPELPDPTNIHAHLKSLPSKDEVHRRQAGAGAGRGQRAHARGDLHQAVSGARLDRAVLRDGDIPQRPDDRLDAFAGRVPAARRTGQGAEDAGEGRALHPRRRLGLLRPERRRRRGARRGAARPRGARTSRCGCNGCATTSSPGSLTARRCR